LFVEPCICAEKPSAFAAISAFESAPCQQTIGDRHLPQTANAPYAGCAVVQVELWLYNIFIVSPPVHINEWIIRNAN
jgi:hypothetical protein